MQNLNLETIRRTLSGVELSQTRPKWLAGMSSPTEGKSPESLKYIRKIGVRMSKSRISTRMGAVYVRSVCYTNRRMEQKTGTRRCHFVHYTCLIVHSIKKYSYIGSMSSFTPHTYMFLVHPRLNAGNMLN